MTCTVYAMTRDRLFAAAREIFERDGLEGLSVRAVARHAGLSPMAMYRHFADKDALLDALMLDGFAAWEARVRAIEAEDPSQWLRSLFAAYLDFALADPHRFDAAFLLPARKARKYPDDFAAGRSPAIGMVMARIEQAKAAGRLGPVEPLEAALTLSALAQGLVSMQRAGRFASEDYFRRCYATAVERGLTFFTAEPGGGRNARGDLSSA
jgi:AcrR family transcriptional regulator